MLWSPEVPFDRPAILAMLPKRAGVYEIRQSQPYPRYLGTTKVLKIGRSDQDLQAEVMNHFTRHTAANRLAWIRAQHHLTITVAFVELPSKETETEEARRLREFEDRHFDLPLLNSQRGYRRDDDRHYRGL